MKYVALMIGLIILNSYCMSQTTALVEYKDGSHKLNHFLTMAYLRSLNSSAGPGAPDTNVQYFLVLFSVDSNGKIGGKVVVTSIGDTTRMPKLLIDIIRKTDGMWVNHTGRIIWVEQSFSYCYKDPDRPKSVLPFQMTVYENCYKEHPIDFVRLEPIHCESYPPVY
jgi:hypothetical protein